MKLVEYNKETKTDEATKTITSIKGLENHDIVLMERGDSLKKDLKKAYNVKGNKNMYSAKGIKEALEKAATKKIKTNTVAWCCVCGEYEAVNGTIYCPECTM